MQQFSTPMMKQYYQIKDKYRDCLLLYRMGDFYELFLEDAHIGARILNIALTSKAGGKDGKIPMAGVPYHAADTYIARLVRAGYKVAICEQLSPPNKRGLVERDVVRVVTPGTVLDEGMLDKKNNNYIVALDYDSGILAVSVADVSTGYFGTYEVEFQDVAQTLRDELSKLSPIECILPDDLYNDAEFLKLLRLEKGINIFPFSEWYTYADQAQDFLKKHFQVASLAVFELEDNFLSQQTSASLLGYLQHTQKTPVAHIKKITKISGSEFMILDKSTMINLELFSTIREHDTRGSLLQVLDATITPMGGRLLKTWLKKPLMNKEAIKLRLDAVESLLTDQNRREELQELLMQIPDIERILSRLSVHIGTARDLVNLKLALGAVLAVKEKLTYYKSSYLKSKSKKSFHFNGKNSSSKLLSNISDTISVKLEEVINLINTIIKDEPAIDLKIGGLIKDGVNPELDKLRKIVSGGKEWIAALEHDEREKTGIGSLKVKFNKVFGFYIEVSRSNLESVPEQYSRKQTLVNGERFITPELKTHEDIILTSEEKINVLEYRLFMGVLEKVLAYIDNIQAAAQGIGILDCLLNFAEISEKRNYIRPVLLYSGEIRIVAGRHPVVEKLLEEAQFVPNDVMLNNISQSLLLITGPNMAGKSVFIRQVALIVLMTQIGCFVPAERAHISIVDRIFVRSGASDVITSGLSTFMVEMVETAHILHNATKNSLIVMDEIGRGTSTYDGISIAWAVAEYLAAHFKTPPKVLFATHYHELQALEEHYPIIRNFHMAVTDDHGTPVFLHAILPGGASHSFGVAVAKLAGVPEEVVEKAQEILSNLEKRNLEKKEKPLRIEYREPAMATIAEHIIHKELENIDISSLTPLQALNKIADLKEKLKLFQESETTRVGD